MRWLALALLAPVAAWAQDEVPASGSNFGRVGLIEMPNARFRPDGTIEGGLAVRRQRSFGFVNFQALPWLEATFRLTERLNGTTGRGTTTDRAFDLRFHLGPGVTATPTADGAGALLKLAQGRVWRIKARGGTVSIEPSLWVDPAGTIHKTQQLVISGRTDRAAARIGWSFKRAGK